MTINRVVVHNARDMKSQQNSELEREEASSCGTKFLITLFYSYKPVPIYTYEHAKNVDLRYCLIAGKQCNKNEEIFKPCKIFFDSFQN